MGLAGKVAIVTGAGRGLGREYAKLLSTDGAQVVVADVNADDAKATTADLEAGGAEALAVAVDVADETSTLELAAAVEARFGRADILVNNAGIWGDLERHPLLSVPVDYWDFVMGVNLRGPLLCTRAVAPTMRAKGCGRIVNISSMGAYMVAGVYGVEQAGAQPAHVRAGQRARRRRDHRECGRARDRSTTRPSAARFPRRDSRSSSRATPVKRLGTADDIYGMIRYLVGDDAGWVTGQTFLVNGGFNTRL